MGGRREMQKILIIEIAIYSANICNYQLCDRSWAMYFLHNLWKASCVNTQAFLFSLRALHT